MITRKEYLNALETIDQYHRQFDLKPKGRKSVDDWIREQKIPIPTRVYNALTYITYSNERLFKFMDEVNKFDFMKIRNVGEKAWIDFCELNK